MVGPDIPASASRSRRQQGRGYQQGRDRPFGTSGGETHPAFVAGAAAAGKAQQSHEGGLLDLAPSAGPIIDIGVNLCHKSFQKSLPAIVKRALAAGVTRMVITGTSERASAAALDLANDHRLSIDPSTGSRVLFSTAGVHPHDAKQWGPETRERLARMHQDPACVAVGECGLDFNRNFSPPQVQEAVFEEQVLMAVALKKPLFCHEREAHSKFLGATRAHTYAPRACTLKGLRTRMHVHAYTHTRATHARTHERTHTHTHVPAYAPHTRTCTPARAVLRLHRVRMRCGAFQRSSIGCRASTQRGSVCIASPAT
jgi:Tat protein secretion system quality control protein TatD with DNase activity